MTTKRSRQKRLELLAIVSDLHSGSTVALMPPTFKLAQGQTVQANALQLWFYECWRDAHAWLAAQTQGAPFGLIANGDLIEGDHHRTDEIVSRRIGDHLEMAVELLTPLAKAAAKTWIVRGTDCHVGDIEVAVGHRLGAERNPETNRPVFDRLTMDICGVRLVAKHHISTTSRPWLEPNALGAELASEQLNAVRNREEMPRIVCAGHRHVAGHVETTDGLCLVTSAWQGLTTHGHKVVSASRCKPSVYLLDWRGLPDGAMPRVSRRIYDAPKAQAIQA